MTRLKININQNAMTTTKIWVSTATTFGFWYNVNSNTHTLMYTCIHTHTQDKNIPSPLNVFSASSGSITRTVTNHFLSTLTSSNEAIKQQHIDPQKQYIQWNQWHTSNKNKWHNLKKNLKKGRKKYHTMAIPGDMQRQLNKRMTSRQHLHSK